MANNPLVTYDPASQRPTNTAPTQALQTFRGYFDLPAELRCRILDHLLLELYHRYEPLHPQRSQYPPMTLLSSFSLACHATHHEIMDAIFSRRVVFLRSNIGVGYCMSMAYLGRMPTPRLATRMNLSDPLQFLRRIAVRGISHFATTFGILRSVLPHAPLVQQILIGPDFILRTRTGREEYFMSGISEERYDPKDENALLRPFVLIR